MPGKGPPKTPTKILKLHGSSRAKRRLDEPEPSPGAPNAPAWLCREAKAEWRRVVPALDGIGLLAKVDRGPLAMMCQAWARHMQAEALIDEHGVMIWGQKAAYKNPACTVSAETYARYHRLAKEFGLTPSARAGLATERKDKNENRGKDRFFTKAGA